MEGRIKRLRVPALFAAVCFGFGALYWNFTSVFKDRIKSKKEKMYARVKPEQLADNINQLKTPKI